MSAVADGYQCFLRVQKGKKSQLLFVYIMEACHGVSAVSDGGEDSCESENHELLLVRTILVCTD